jgi:hypothetical protein
LAASFGIAVATPVATAQASVVTVDFAGTVNDTNSGYAVGTAYSGSFAYDTSAEAKYGSVAYQFKGYGLDAFSITVGGDTLTPLPSSLPPWETTRIEVGFGSAFFSSGFIWVNSGELSGTGPLVGGFVDIFYSYTSDPSVNTLWNR